MRSLDEVPAATYKLLDGALVRSVFFLLMPIMEGPLFLQQFFMTRSTLGRAGCAIGVLGSVIAVTYMLLERHRLLLIERRRLKETWQDYIYNDVVACAHFYKEQLKRCDNLWIYGSSFLCWMLGKWLCDHYDHVDMFMWVSLSMLFIFILLVMSLVKQQKLRRIEEIDALLAERPPD
jgi:hypothetical protein